MRAGSRSLKYKVKTFERQRAYYFYENCNLTYELELDCYVVVKSGLEN